MAIYTQSLAFY